MKEDHHQPYSPEAERGVLACCLINPANAVETVLRNLPPVEPFVVKWQYPVFVPASGLDPSRLKQSGGRPAKYTEKELLDSLLDKRLTTAEWRDLTMEESGMSKGTFDTLKKALQQSKKVLKSVTDGKWEEIRSNSNNWYDDKDQ